MSKYIVEASGKVESKRHRNLEVWAKSEEDALVKARDMFISAVSRSKSSELSLKDVELKIISNDR